MPFGQDQKTLAPDILGCVDVGGVNVLSSEIAC